MFPFCIKFMMSSKINLKMYLEHVSFASYSFLTTVVENENVVIYWHALIFKNHIKFSSNSSSTLTTNSYLSKVMFLMIKSF